MKSEIRVPQLIAATRSDNIYCFVNPEWATSSSDSNSSSGSYYIREDLAEFLKSQWGISAPALDLKRSPPTAEGISISISHCPLAGGWIAAKEPLQVGFDVEDVSRLQPRIIERVSSIEEIRRSYDIADLWPAKEATFKALWNFGQPATISEIQILEWREIRPDVRLFKASTLGSSPPLKGSGAVMAQNGIKIGIFALNFGRVRAEEF